MKGKAGVYVRFFQLLLSATALILVSAATGCSGGESPPSASNSVAACDIRVRQPQGETRGSLPAPIAKQTLLYPLEVQGSGLLFGVGYNIIDNSRDLALSNLHIMRRQGAEIAAKCLTTSPETSPEQLRLDCVFNDPLDVASDGNVYELRADAEGVKPGSEITVIVDEVSASCPVAAPSADDHILSS